MSAARSFRPPDQARLGRDGTVLLYEDDDDLAAEIVLAFAAEGERVERVVGEAALRERVARGAGVLLLDRIVDGHDSLLLLEERRAEGHHIPVLVISSLATVDDRIRGLKAGGDDYLTKPFAMTELLARTAALRRRATTEQGSVLVAGPLRMDLIARQATRDGRPLPLAPREFVLLQYLMRHAGQVVTRAMLLEDVWQVRAATRTNVVDVHIGNLRRKIEEEGERLIESVRGCGFVLCGEGRRGDGGDADGDGS